MKGREDEIWKTFVCRNRINQNKSWTCYKSLSCQCKTQVPGVDAEQKEGKKKKVSLLSVQDAGSRGRRRAERGKKDRSLSLFTARRRYPGETQSRKSEIRKAGKKKTCSKHDCLG